MVKKTSMGAYNRSRREGIIAIRLKDDDELISVHRVKTGQKVILVSSAGKAIKWDESEARAMGRDTAGVRGMTIKEDEKVLGMEIAIENTDLFVITDNGYGKRTSVDEYPEHHRGGQGVSTIKMTEKKGKLAGMKVIKPQHELMIISEEGVVIRVKGDDINELKRATQGVRVMNLKPGDKVSAIARVTQETKQRSKKNTLEGQEQLPLEEDDDSVDVLLAELDGDDQDE